MEIGKILITKEGVFLELDIPFVDDEINSQLEEANKIIAKAIQMSFELSDK